MASSAYDSLYRLIESLPVVSTHEHHLPDDFQNSLTLDRILERERSYVGWVLDLTPGLDASSRAEFLAKCRHNSYYVWLEKGIQRVYGFREKITSENWDRVSLQISAFHADPDAHLRILTETGRYRRAIEDAYFDPGSDLGHPELFASNFRTDMFVRCFPPDVLDHDSMNPFRHYPGIPTGNFNDYLDAVQARVLRWRQNGGVALKSASAYDRPLSYKEIARLLPKYLAGTRKRFRPANGRPMRTSCSSMSASRGMGRSQAWPTTTRTSAMPPACTASIASRCRCAITREAIEAKVAMLETQRR